MKQYQQKKHQGKTHTHTPTPYRINTVSKKYCNGWRCNHTINGKKKKRQWIHHFFCSRQCYDWIQKLSLKLQHTNITLLSRQRRPKHGKKYNQINDRKKYDTKHQSTQTHFTRSRTTDRALVSRITGGAVEIKHTRYDIRNEKCEWVYSVDLSKHENKWQEISLTCPNTKINARKYRWPVQTQINDRKYRWPVKTQK